MKIRQGFVSNSSSCSFVICLELITDVQREQIKKWYKDTVDSGTYMDDCGSYCCCRGPYITGRMAYVRDEFLEFMGKIGVPIESILLMES